MACRTSPIASRNPAAPDLTRRHPPPRMGTRVARRAEEVAGSPLLRVASPMILSLRKAR
ncbi:Uncharacterised protein [Bordetella pertussis]|nr:Uncharacterised protein [Bordetella pertussis]